MDFLVANDDGILAAGVKILCKTLQNFGKVTVYCPDRERSANSHAITTKEPLRAHPIDFMPDVEAYAVNGSPADCAMLGLMHQLDTPPDFVIGGINMGVNVGQDIYYSGTISVAREAVLKGHKGIAISMVSQKLLPETEDRMIKDLTYLLETIFKQAWKDKKIISLNLPDYHQYEKAKGVKVISPNIEEIKFSLIKDTDPKGREIFWSIDQTHQREPQENSEKYWLQEGYILISPIDIIQENSQLNDEISIWFEGHPFY